MKEESQKNLKSISKCIYIITKILKIVMIIATIFIMLGCVFLLSTVKNLEYSNGVLKYNGSEESIKFVQEEKNGDKVWLVKVKDSDVITIDDKDSVVNIEEFLNNNPLETLSKVIIIGMVYFIIIAITYVYIMSAIEKVFRNIHDEDTPFINENVKQIKSIACGLILLVVISTISGCLFNAILHVNINVKIDVAQLIEALAIFAIAFVFEYGCALQEGSDKKIY